MMNYKRYAGMLESIIQGIFPNATPPVLGRLDDIIHDLALDWEELGRWFNIQIHTKKLSLQELDLIGITYQFIAHDFTQYMKDQYQEIVPALEIEYNDEDTRFINWHELTFWIEGLKQRNPHAYTDGFVQGMYTFLG